MSRKPADLLAALARGFRCHDISVTLGREDVTYPGDPPFARELLASLAAGAPFELAGLSMSAHAGTHLDAPAHFLAGGPTVDALPPERCILPAVVVAATGRQAVDAATLEGVAFAPGEAVLFRTDNSLTGRCRSGAFSPDWVALTAEAAARLAAGRAGLAGLDAISVDRWGDETYAVHRRLLGAGVLVLEGLDLSGVAPGRYVLLCLPLKIGGGEAAPVRAVLLSPEA